MSFPPHPTPTARECFVPAPREALLYRTLLALVDRAGIWRRPIRASGDLETMTFRDKVYWVYKAARPIERAQRGSGLEAHFARQHAHHWELPEGFAVDHQLSISAVGDLMNHAFLAGSRETLYRETAPLIFDVDVAMANLECVVTTAPRDAFVITPRSGPRLSMSPDELDVARGAAHRGYDFLATACNHTLDFGTDGVASTIAALRERGIAFHGVNERAEDARRPAILTRNGIRLGIVSFTFGLNGRKPPADRPDLVNTARLNHPPSRARLEPLEAQLRACKDDEVDFVVAQLHWGLEHELYPRPEQVELAHHLAELGVDAIIGHHPHVIQPFEAYRTRRDPTRVVPIFYSLGNLTTPFSLPIFRRSQVARIRLGKGRTARGDQRTFVADARAHDVVQVADEERRSLTLTRAESVQTRCVHPAWAHVAGGPGAVGWPGGPDE